MNAQAWSEQGTVFECGPNRLVGIAALPEQAFSDIGVIILVGGPQYRVGSHRQFTLLARDLAAAGVPSLRFDFTGMGDSEGEQREFSAVQEDIGAAVDALVAACPAVQRVVLWGLCDAASAAMMFAHEMPRVCGLVLLNPWVHGVELSPEVKFSHYYRPLLVGRENWQRLLSGKIAVLPALREFTLSSLGTIAGWFGLSGARNSRHSFVDQMLHGYRAFAHDSLIILSEEDLTAREFAALAANDNAWKALLAKPATTTCNVAGADHTFSARTWKDAVSRLTVDWVKNLK